MGRWFVSVLLCISCQSRAGDHGTNVTSGAGTASAMRTSDAGSGVSPASGALCPDAEPAQGGGCSVAVGSQCTYTIAAVRDDFCHCFGANWDCGPPAGIDSPENAPGCPASHPAVGSTCTLKAPDPYPGTRAGCHYQVAATPILHECECAHPAAGGRATWLCGPYAGAMVDAHGCPSRKPAADTLCVVAADAQCQYDYDLTTTCKCRPLSGGKSAWTCVHHDEPPSPGAPAPH
jgi:hypothetical protein